MSYHVRIMNIPAYEDAPFEYKEGHRDARHAAAEIANEAEAEAERLQARERELRMVLAQTTAAVHSAHDFILEHCGETNPETGEIIDASALPTWNLLCEALAAVSAETEDDDD